MQPPSTTTVLLVILLVVLNGKAILNYWEWLKFKIKTSRQQRQNERRDHTNNRPRTIHS